MTFEKNVSGIVLSVAAATLLTFSGCGGGSSSDTTPNTSSTSNTSSTASTSSESGVVVLKGDIEGDMTLDANKVYEIEGKVNFKNGQLTIPAGTTLYGSTPSSYLAINAGATIEAKGTQAKPIVFTSKADYEGTSFDNAKGEWGGLVILGNAWTNLGIKTYEAGDQQFGSTTHEHDAENSGTLEYVVVKHTGFEVETDKELNGLSLAGVGSGTTIRNVAIIGGADDAIEIWGGTVNIDGLYLYNASDDSLDTDLGYSGTVSNVLAVQVAGNVDKDTFDSSTIETGNDNNVIENDTDITSTKVVNGTFKAVGGGIYMKNDAGMTFSNVKIVLNNEVTPDQAIITHRTEDVNNINKMFATSTGICLVNQQQPTALYATSNPKDETTATAAAFWPTNVQDAANVHENDDTTCSGADEAMIWKGKAGSNDPLENPNAGTNVEVLEGDITGDKTLSASSVYEIKGKVNFKSGKLTIPAGTTLYGATPSSYLAINAGATIEAIGTMEKPIVFTSKTDYTGNSSDNAKGEWGGLVILGNAWTNLGIKTYEAGDQQFGSTTHEHDAENSGTLEYVVVKHTGFEVETDKELNGLSLAGVGSGTTIRNVAIIGGADDAIEIWGGTVNIDGLYLYNASDDSLDTDLGYSGTVSNVLAVQVAGNVDKDTFDSSTIETGNDNNVIENDTDITSTKVVNGTFKAVGGGIYMKNDAGMTFSNVKIVLNNEVTPDQAIITHRTEDVNNINKMFATSTGICLVNQQQPTALYATSNPKDETTATAAAFWPTNVQDAANVHENDDTTCSGADEAMIWKGKAGSYDALEN